MYMKKLPTIFLGVGLILATIPRVTIEKTEERFVLTVGGAIPELIVKCRERKAEKKETEPPAED